MIKEDFNVIVKSLAVIKSYQGRGYHDTEISNTVNIVKSSFLAENFYGDGLAPDLQNEDSNKENKKTKKGRKKSILCTLTRVKNHFSIRSDKKEFNINGQKLKKGQARILMNADKVSLADNSNFHFFFNYISDQVPTSFPKNIMASYHVSEKIGNGACGHAYLVFDIKTGNKLAMKKSAKDRKETREEFSREAQIQLKLNHPNIVKLLKAYNTAPASYLFTEFLNSRDILSIITKRKDNCLEEDETRKCLYQIVQAIKYLHNQNICHLDIKCDNIFVHQEEGKFICKLGDFGLSWYNDNLTESIGTLVYSPPELLFKQSQITYDGKCCDIWSLGVTMYSMISGHFPFTHNSKNKLRLVIKEAKINFERPIWQKVSNFGKHLICSMINKDPKSRLRIDEVEKHPFFTDSNCAKDYELAFAIKPAKQENAPAPIPMKSKRALAKRKSDVMTYDSPANSTRSKKPRIN